MSDSRIKSTGEPDSPTMLNVLVSMSEGFERISGMLSGHKIDIIEDIDKILSVIKKSDYDLALIQGGIDTLERIKTADPRVEVVLFGDEPDHAVEAVLKGAADYIVPPMDMERISTKIESIYEFKKKRRRVLGLEKLLSTNYINEGIVGRNPKMLDVLDFARRIAPYYKILTITGETGTGKEVLARTIHTLSPVNGEPVVVCNCGAVVEGLIDSELFGHIKGSFTSASSDKEGLFKAVGRGTLLLDEIGEMPMQSQPNLLRVLQNGEFRPVGSVRSQKADCRIIALTNRNLGESVRAGNFREDLFYRLTPITIHLPALRERKDDVPLLCRAFIEKFNKSTGKNIQGISRPAQAALMAYSWPGNIRELENVIEQSVILSAESFISIDVLPKHIVEFAQQMGEGARTPDNLEDVIKAHVAKVLFDSNGNRTVAAGKLGISRRSIIRYIQKYSLDG